MKRYIAWARVSSLRQKEEGWSLEQQEERLKDYAARNGGNIVKLYVVTETASKYLERKTFQEMLRFAKQNQGKLDGLLVMKIDRAARNMRDFLELEKLEEDHGIRLISVTQPTESTPSGKMMRRTFATFATFFTEQLSVDVKQAMKRRAEAGLFVTLAPYGYRNVIVDKRRVVQTDPVEALVVRRIFHLYANCNHTLASLREALYNEGAYWKSSQPRWTHSKLYELLLDRSYIGEVDHLKTWYPGTHEPIIDRALFDRVQERLGKKVCRSHDMLFASKLIACGYCGRPITGERKKKLARSFTYYRCCRYNAPGHPRVRVREEALDRQMLDVFDRMRLNENWAEAWQAVFAAKASIENDEVRARREQLAAELTRVRGQKDSLLNLRLAGEVDSETYLSKHQDLRDREGRLQSQLNGIKRGEADPDITSRAFELSQTLTDRWVSSDQSAKRQILEVVCLNLTLRDVTLELEMRSPFGQLTEGLIPAFSAKDQTPLEQAERFRSGLMLMPDAIRSMVFELTDRSKSVKSSTESGESHVQ